jgi:SAM-dependent methyltransferase
VLVRERGEVQALLRAALMDPLAENRALWAEWARFHETAELYDLETFRRGGVRLRPYELEELGDVSGLDVLHLQCHIGTDTLSLARLGARVTGLDFSEEALEVARRLAADCGLEARWFCADATQPPAELHGAFDLVYSTRGVLWWLPDLAAWARAVAVCLRPGGFLYLADGHPMLGTLEQDGVGPGELLVRYRYFTSADPEAFAVEGSYAGSIPDARQTTEYGWAHGLGEVVTALLDAGLRLELLRERPTLDWPVRFLEEREDGSYGLPPGTPGEIPLMFSLRARKPG